MKVPSFIKQTSALKGARHEMMMENDVILGQFWQAVEQMLQN
jgi:hypothetical protein